MIVVPSRESARLQALARVAEAVSSGGGLEAVVAAVASGLKSSFGLDTVLNLYEEETDRYVVRAVVGEGQRLMGETYARIDFENLLDERFEVVPDVYFIAHDQDAPIEELGAIYTRQRNWRGPGYWHSNDMCFVRMRTSQGKAMGILSVDSVGDDLVPSFEGFELIRLFAMVAANAVENVLLMQELKDLELEREMKSLRQELQEEVALRRSLLDIGTRLGAASATASRDIFELLIERLNAVVPVKALTIYVHQPERGVARPVYHSHDNEVDAEAIMAFEVPIGTGATGTAARLARSILSNAGDPGRRKVDVPGSTDTDDHLLAVPVLVEERVKAVLTLRRPETEPPFVPLDCHRAELFAQHVATVFLLSELAESRTRLAEQVEQLQDLNRLKDEFVANVSHELRTPITAIIGNVMTVAGLGDMLGAEERRELLVAAERQAKRLAELLENLLAESRLTGDDPALVPVRIDVGPFLEEVRETLRFRAPEREVAISSPRLEVVTDRTLLYRILFNLGDNALKYSDGPVRLSAGPDGDGIRIDVADRGVGIAPEDIPRIFEQFHQLDGSSSRRVGGVGLGLHLCAKAAETLGGRIDVASRPGEGSTFSVWLPAAYRRGA
jgi:signal transduction histidine kinase